MTVSAGEGGPRGRRFARAAGFHPMVAVCLNFFALSVFLLGFQPEVLKYYMQYLDFQVLHDDFWRSLFFLHSQPPLQNAVLGLAAALFGAEGVAIFAWVLFHVLALTNIALVYRLLRGFAGERAAVGGSFLFSILPSTLLFTGLPYSALPGQLLVNLFLLAFVLQDRRKAAAAGVGGMVLLTLHHGLFNAFAMLPVVALFWLRLGDLGVSVGRRWAFAAACLAPAFALMLKNLMVFGFFGLSSWAGCNLANIAGTPNFNAAGEAIPIAGERAQLPPALGKPIKSSGFLNWNHISVIEICDDAGKQAWQRIERDPEGYFFMVLRVMRISFARFPSDYSFFSEELRSLGGLDRFYAPFTGMPDGLKALVNIAIFILAPFFVLSRAATRSQRLFALAGGYLVLLAVVGASVTNGVEQERVRFMVQGFAWVCAMSVFANSVLVRKINIK